MKCMYFNGKNSTITIKHDVKYNVFPLVIDCWLKTKQTENQHCSLINKYISGSSNGWSLNIKNGSISFWIYNNGICGCDFSSDTKICDNKWHHIKVIVNKNVDIYIDGNKDTSRVCNIHSPNQCNTDIVIGKYQGSNGYYNGYIAELSISNKIPKENQIIKYKLSEKAYIKKLISLWKIENNNIYDIVNSTKTEYENIKIEEDETCHICLYKYLIKMNDKYYSPLKDHIQNRSFINLDISADIIEGFKKYGFDSLDLLLDPISIETITLIPIDEFKNSKLLIYNEYE